MTAALSRAGSVLGMTQRVVKPPRTAASAPVATVSFSSKPGSRRWQCRSMKPGETTRPFGVEHGDAGRDGPAMARGRAPRHGAVVDEHVADDVEALRGVEDAAAPDEQ